jgi:hypothetical protein
MWRINRFVYGIKNLIRWFPVIWKDQDWDGYYTLKILQRKIKNVRVYNEKRKFYVGVENEIKWMKTCERLLELHFTAWEKEDEDVVVSLNGVDENKEYFSSTIKCQFGKLDLLEHKSEQLFWKILAWKNKYWWD